MVVSKTHLITENNIATVATISNEVSYQTYLITRNSYDNNLEELIPDLETMHEEEENNSVMNLIKNIKEKSFKGWASVAKNFNGEIVSCAALERDEKYSGDNISARFCRYYKQKKFRKVKYNLYKYLNTYARICKSANIDVMYFTIFNPRVIADIRNPRSASMYDRYTTAGSIRDFKERDDILFKVDDHCIQRVFTYDFTPDTKWSPTGMFIPMPEEGFSDEKLQEMYDAQVARGQV